MGIGRNVVTVCAGSTRWAHAFGVTAPIETRAIEVSLRRVVGGSDEVEPAALFVGAINPDHIVIAVSNEFGASV